MALGACAYVLLFRRDAWLRGPTGGGGRRSHSPCSYRSQSSCRFLPHTGPGRPTFRRRRSCWPPSRSTGGCTPESGWSPVSRSESSRRWLSPRSRSQTPPRTNPRSCRTGPRRARVVAREHPGLRDERATRVGLLAEQSSARDRRLLPARVPDVALEQYYYEALDGDRGFAIANGNLGAALSRAQAIRWLAVDLRSPTTARVLSTEQVRYVVIKDGAYTAAGRRSPTLDPRYYTLAKRIDGVWIYRVHAPTIRLGPSCAHTRPRSRVVRASSRPGSRFSRDSAHPSRVGRTRVGASEARA